MTHSLLVALLAVVPVVLQAPAGSTRVGCLAAAPKARWPMPPALREISGLAFTVDGRLLAHNDEVSRVVELDRASGRVVKSFRLGRSFVRGDFEALTMVGPRLFLATSTGVLFEAREGADNASVPFTALETGAGSVCEVEGLSHDPAARALLLLCKTAIRGSLKGTVTVLRWSLEQNRWSTPGRLLVPLDAEFQRAFGQSFRGSDLARDPVTGNYLAIAGLNRVAVEFTPTGRFLGRSGLGGMHRQAEGVAIAPDGTIYVADEGANSAGTVSVYACRR